MKDILKEYGSLILSFIGGLFVIIMAYFLFRGGVAAGILLRLIEGAT